MNLIKQLNTHNNQTTTNAQHRTDLKNTIENVLVPSQQIWS